MQLQQGKSILDKEMDRREFLLHIGAGFLAILGISSIIKAFAGSNHSSNILGPQHDPSGPGGYGARAYGR